MKHFVASTIICLAAQQGMYSSEKNVHFFDTCFNHMSDGVGLLLSGCDVRQGSQKVIQAVTDVASVIVEEHKLSHEEAQEIQECLVMFDKELSMLGSRQQTKTDGDKELLAKGIKQLVYHMFVLSTLRKNVSFHVKNIISALLKIISVVLDATSSDFQELSQVNETLQDAVNKKILCHVCN